jgi:hypothetical protein
MDSQNRRRINYRFQIDANRINARGNLQYMAIIEKWKQNKVIRVMMAQRAQDEAAHGNQRRAKKAYTYIASITESNAEDIKLFESLEKIMFPDGAKTQNEKNDIEIVFNSRKYGCILITNDGGSKRQPAGILGNRDKLQQIGIDVMTDKEAVEFIKQCIIERDNLERERSKITGQSLPDWLGTD